MNDGLVEVYMLHLQKYKYNRPVHHGEKRESCCCRIEAGIHRQQFADKTASAMALMRVSFGSGDKR